MVVTLIALTAALAISRGPIAIEPPYLLSFSCICVIDILFFYILEYTYEQQRRQFPPGDPAQPALILSVCLPS